VVELGFSLGAVVHYLLAESLKTVAVIKELLSEVSNPLLIILSEVLFDLSVSVVLLKVLEGSVNGFFQVLGTAEELQSFVGKSFSQSLDSIEVVHSGLDIAVYLDFSSECILDSLDFILLSLLSS
jgi:hypothetical protein